MKHADEGSQGSGFLVGVPAKKITGASFIFAVANQHVLDSGADVIRLNMVDGRKKIIETDPPNGIPHPKGDDLAVEKNGLARTRANRAGNLNFSPFGQAGPCGGGPNQ